ncbi:MAG: excinuclease ABC subunit UvrB [Alphaproteobacteria bacterium]|nr:excinuclease ABC subunit UvrB [Rickettsiales bacterium]
MSSVFSQSKPFELVSPVKPAGDQIKAIKALIEGLQENKRDQILLGVTGSGKTFTMANVILKTQRPALIMVHNKILAAQLFNEMKQLFPNNAVEYFVSYYDYYQPEAYNAKTDTYIEKSSLINKQIEILRHSTTRSLMERKDVIIVTSVSSIYGIGSPMYYEKMNITIETGKAFPQDILLRKLTQLDYKRSDIDFDNGQFRVLGESVEIYPPYSEDTAIRILFNYDQIEEIQEFDPLTGAVVETARKVTIYPSSHHATPHHILKNATKTILEELKERVDFFHSIGKNLEAQRLEQRTRYDIEMMLEIGHLKGIENYSIHIDGRNKGDPPHTLFSYLPENLILFADESHATLPQIRGMFAGDKSRKTKLIEHGFRLPSALDNRPLQFEEWNKIRGQTIYVSATPGKDELSITNGEVVEQIIRPTGLVDPQCEVRPLENHFDDLVNEIKKMTENNLRSIVIVLTKKMAEKTHAYLEEIGIKSMYMHSSTETLERIKIIQMLRDGRIEAIVGINLLREGIDIPECGLVAITDADKEGFLRSQTSLTQIVGRAARNTAGKVIFYANKITKAMKNTFEETDRRREVQTAYNLKHNIKPKNIEKPTDTVFNTIFGNNKSTKNKKVGLTQKQKGGTINIEKEISSLMKKMKKAAYSLDFELATDLREQVKLLKRQQLLNPNQ